MDQRDDQKVVQPNEGVKSAEGSCKTSGSPSLPAKRKSTKLTLPARTRTSQGCTMHACDLPSTALSRNKQLYLIQCLYLQASRYSVLLQEAVSLLSLQQRQSSRNYRWCVHEAGSVPGKSAQAYFI